jgi:hypothetical protein
MDVRLLEELRRLLGRHGHEERASFIESLIHQGDSQELWVTLGGTRVLGGSGAIWEVQPFRFSHPAASRSHEDYRRFQALLADLGSLLDAKGFRPCRRARSDSLAGSSRMRHDKARADERLLGEEV